MAAASGVAGGEAKRRSGEEAANGIINESSGSHQAYVNDVTLFV